MAKYTTQLKSVVESGHPIFDFTYPIFDTNYKSILEQKIIDHYYFREIGFETVAQFKHYLKDKLNRIMPYYNDQYEAYTKYKTFDPYVNKDITTTVDRTLDSESSGTSEGSGTSRDIFSDTPQAKLSGLDYATNLSDTESESTATGTNTGKTTESYVQSIKGFDGMKYASDVYEGVKDSFINIDQLIIDDLNDLFMSVY